MRCWRLRTGYRLICSRSRLKDIHRLDAKPPQIAQIFCLPESDPLHTSPILKYKNGGGAELVPTTSNAGCCCGSAGTVIPVEAALGAARSREFVAEHWSSPATPEQGEKSDGPSLGEWDVFLERKRTHTFCISGMAFQDAWTLDLERLRGCYIHTASPDGRLVPFCAYNLTDRQGHSLYRP